MKTLALSLSPFIWLLLSSIGFAVGEYLSKKWGMAPSFPMTLLVLSSYAFSSLLWLPVLLHKNHLASMGSAWLILATIMTIGVGVLVFKETLNSWQIFGVILGIIAFILISIE